MIKTRLRSWVKVVLVIIVVAIIFSLLNMIVEKIDGDFVDNCVEAGYSRQHCERVK